MSITEIKKTLRECGLLLTGRKQELEARLLRLGTLTCTKDDFPYKKVSDKYKEKKQKKIDEEMKEEVKEEECCICMDAIESDIYKTNCKHYFHKGCMESWLENSSTCPICRSQVGDEEVRQEVPNYYTDAWYGIERDINNADESGYELHLRNNNRNNGRLNLQLNINSMQQLNINVRNNAVESMLMMDILYREQQQEEQWRRVYNRMRSYYQSRGELTEELDREIEGFARNHLW